MIPRRPVFGKTADVTDHTNSLDERASGGNLMDTH